MASYYINGGNPLHGEITVSGSKNAALGIIAAACVLDGPCVIENMPHVSDIETQLELCRNLGAKVEVDADGTVHFDATSIYTHEITDERARNIRASYYFLGALLARFGKARNYLPGGCNFGTRPIDLHLKGFNAMGAAANLAHGFITLEADDFHGEHIFLDKVSVGATMNLMIAASKAKGRTTIENAAREPHIVDVANFLNSMGAKIRGAGTDVIRIEGREVLPAGSTYAIIPDQIEAGTYMIAAAATRGDVTVRNLIPKHMEPLSAKMDEIGVHMETGDDWIRVWTEPGQELSATSFRTMAYPGFPTDLQPQAVVLLCTCTGMSKMYEDVWASRFQYVDDLKQMGADITVADRVALIQGPRSLTGAMVQARDLRAGAAMVLAGLAATGMTEVFDIHSLERGYEDLILKLRSIGADIRKSSDVYENAEREL
ncbi:MAG: UDP-N-acetylglucosamine 1-carboxyvinyltransferase [Clostridiaceae bacterium]|nr:UDP-N-acetylglucosamine 1-carboxyvinyltransferase [Clostridiaceae bacterium]